MVQFYTRLGMVKRTNLEDYQAQKTKIAACGLKTGDAIINIEIIKGNEEIFLATKHGMSIRFDAEAISPTGRTARGVIGIKLIGDDEVRVAQIVNEGDEIIILTDRGIGKRSRLTDYPQQGRAGKGCKTIAFYKNQSNGTEITHGLIVDYPFDFVITQKDGTVTELNTKNVTLQEREGKGKAIAMVLMDNVVDNVYRQYQQADVLQALDIFNKSKE
jgi:DNA gyrase subunit A